MELVFHFGFPDTPAAPCALPPSAIGKIKKQPHPKLASMVDWKDIETSFCGLYYCVKQLFLNGCFHSKFI